MVHFRPSASLILNLLMPVVLIGVIGVGLMYFTFIAAPLHAQRSLVVLGRE